MSGANRHYERAFEAMLTGGRVPHVLVKDARRALLPTGAVLAYRADGGGEARIKSFDAVVYQREQGVGPHLLVEVKGRRVDLRKGGSGRRESWTTADDVASLRAWERLFGAGYEGVLLFLYWLEGPRVNALEAETFRFEGRVYAHRAVRLSDYARLMRVRSPKWGTVNLGADDFDGVSVPLGSLLKTGSRSCSGLGGGSGDRLTRGPVACGSPMA